MGKSKLVATKNKKIEEDEKKSCIQYLRRDATKPQGEGNKIIAHITNTYDGKWIKGFVAAISQRFGDYPAIQYQTWKWEEEGIGFKLGAVQLLKVEDNIWIANMVAQQGYGETKGPPKRCVKYDAVAECLSTVSEHAKSLNASVHMPRIGCGLGGGSWDMIEPIIQKTLQGVQVFVYDFE